MNSKPEKRVRIESSMGPKGFGKTLKCVKVKATELLRPYKNYR